jgi:hypothetical protein
MECRAMLVRGDMRDGRALPVATLALLMARARCLACWA